MKSIELSSRINFLQAAWNSFHADLCDAMQHAQRTPIARGRCRWIEQQLMSISENITSLRKLEHESSWLGNMLNT